MMHSTLIVFAALCQPRLALTALPGSTDCGAIAGCDLLVETSLFTVQGAVSPETPEVRQFLGIPFAEAPVRELRFRPPVTKKPTNEVINATRYGPYCIAHGRKKPPAKPFQLPGGQQPSDQVQSEDCLTLDIWAPRAACISERVGARRPAVGRQAVMIWIHGGALVNGASSPPNMRGTKIVEAHDDIIVVSINYRVNIFGFPGAEALDGRQLSPGFLDVRAAVKWIYQNIHYFGGNPDQMILFGDSAGATCVDVYNYAWAHDPLVKGFIMMSGQGEVTNDPNDNPNFTYVANQVNCTSGDKDEQFECLQQANPLDIADVLQTYDSKAAKSLAFLPKWDNQTTFSNYTDIQVRGRFSKLPQIIGTCDNEYAGLVPRTMVPPNQTVIDSLSDTIFVCRAAKAAKARQVIGSPIWRYRYFGEWPNQNPLQWMHAYHGSDVAMVFGTTSTFAPDTTIQAEISVYMQSVFIEFTKDPEHALTDNFGWPRYIEDQDTLVRLAYNNETRPSFVRGSYYDGNCDSTQALRDGHYVG